MRTLVVYANPNMTGHCHAILESVKFQLEVRGEKFNFVDLNEELFDPVTHVDELYTAGGTTVTEQTKKYMNQIKAADKIIFIYPVWWNTMPAIMKGYIDKVMAGRFAFQFVKKPYLPFAIPQGLLTGKKAAVFVTTGARGWMMTLFMGNRYKKIIAKDILGYCGIKAKVFSTYNCTKWNDSKKPAIENRVKKALKWLY